MEVLHSNCDIIEERLCVFFGPNEPDKKVSHRYSPQLRFEVNKLLVEAKLVNGQLVLQR